MIFVLSEWMLKAILYGCQRTPPFLSGHKDGMLLILSRQVIARKALLYSGKVVELSTLKN